MASPKREEASDIAPLPAACPRSPARIPLARHGVAPVLHAFDGLIDDGAHIALVFEPWPQPLPLVRVHSSCLTGDVFGSLRCDCGPQLDHALGRLAAEGGLLVYLEQEGRGIGLRAKLEAYRLQDLGLDTYEANRRLGYAPDARDYAPAAQMLLALGARRVRLLTSNPDKVSQLRRYGVDIVEVVPTPTFANRHNLGYLRTKAASGAHALDPEALARSG
jgi:GTP cyclohydrolase II